MSKALIVEELKRAGGIVGEPDSAVDAVFDALDRVVRSGERVTIRGFGNFEMKDRAARVGRHPKTGGRVEIPERRVIVFKASKAT